MHFRRASVYEPWNFQSDGPIQSGQQSILLTTKGFRQFVLQPTDTPLSVGKDDKLFAWVYLDPKNPPKEIMLQWHSNNWLHRAYWGENKVEFGKTGTTERHHMGDLPEPGKWVKLEVPIDVVGIKPGTKLNGIAFTQFDGSVYWDHSGIVTMTPQPGQSFDSFTDWLQAQGKGNGLPNDLKKLVSNKKRNAKQTQQLVDHFVKTAYSKTRTIIEPLVSKREELAAEKEKLTNAMPTTLVFKELAKPKPAFVLNRGEYDQKGEPVSRRVPGFLPPMPKDASKDRLGFAQWLVCQ